MYWGSKMVSKWIKPNWDLCRASLKLGFSATISVQALYVYFPKIFSFAHLRIIPKSTDIYLILTSLEKIKGEGEFGNMSLGNSNWSGSGRSSKNARFFLIASKFAHIDLSLFILYDHRTNNNPTKNKKWFQNNLGSSTQYSQSSA